MPTAEPLAPGRVPVSPGPPSARDLRVFEVLYETPRVQRTYWGLLTQIGSMVGVVPIWILKTVSSPHSVLSENVSREA
jgi:hypothetical protein